MSDAMKTRYARILNEYMQMSLTESEDDGHIKERQKQDVMLERMDGGILAQRMPDAVYYIYERLLTTSQHRKNRYRRLHPRRHEEDL